MKPKNLSKQQWKLLKKRRIVRLAGDVDGRMGWQVSDSLEWLQTQGSPDAHLHGRVTSEFFLY